MVELQFRKIAFEADLGSQNSHRKRKSLLGGYFGGPDLGQNGLLRFGLAKGVACTCDRAHARTRDAVCSKNYGQGINSRVNPT